MLQELRPWGHRCWGRWRLYQWGRDVRTEFVLVFVRDCSFMVEGWSSCSFKGLCTLVILYVAFEVEFGWFCQTVSCWQLRGTVGIYLTIYYDMLFLLVCLSSQGSLNARHLSSVYCFNVDQGRTWWGLGCCLSCLATLYGGSLVLGFARLTISNAELLSGSRALSFYIHGIVIGRVLKVANK